MWDDESSNLVKVVSSHICDHTSVAKKFDVACGWTMPQLLWASQGKAEFVRMRWEMGKGQTADIFLLGIGWLWTMN